MTIRPLIQDDITPLQAVLDATELFPSEMLPDMVAGYLESGDSTDIWLTATHEGRPVGLCYATPEALTDGTWNMLAIAVLPDLHGQGIGGAITAHLEARLRDQGARVLIADTSGTDAFADTRAFYAAKGYTEEARIRDFWEAGDDKIVFWKALRG